MACVVIEWLCNVLHVLPNFGLCNEPSCILLQQLPMVAEDMVWKEVVEGKLLGRPHNLLRLLVIVPRPDQPLHQIREVMLKGDVMLHGDQPRVEVLIVV